MVWSARFDLPHDGRGHSKTCVVCWISQEASTHCDRQFGTLHRPSERNSENTWIGRKSNFQRMVSSEAHIFTTFSIAVLPKCSRSSSVVEILSRIYSIDKNFPRYPRNKIILIKRTKQRKFTEQKEIEEVVMSAANHFNLSYALYRDDPTPSFKDTMILFKSAVMIVAPHGAALSNLIFSDPGTYVVEAVCHAPVFILCFQRLAQILGQRWHGIPSTSGCPDVLNVTAVSINDTVWRYLEIHRSLTSSSYVSWTYTYLQSFRDDRSTISLCGGSAFSAFGGFPDWNVLTRETGTYSGRMDLVDHSWRMMQSSDITRMYNDFFDLVWSNRSLVCLVLLDIESIDTNRYSLLCEESCAQKKNLLNQPTLWGP